MATKLTSFQQHRTPLNYKPKIYRSSKLLIVTGMRLSFFLNRQSYEKLQRIYGKQGRVQFIYTSGTNVIIVEVTGHSPEIFFFTGNNNLRASLRWPNFGIVQPIFERTLIRSSREGVHWPHLQAKTTTLSLRVSKDLPRSSIFFSFQTVTCQEQEILSEKNWTRLLI